MSWSGLTISLSCPVLNTGIGLKSPELAAVKPPRVEVLAMKHAVVT
ncbi:MAG: hypothetical protein AAF420_07185 [Pseudomonadota bacterium]